MSPFAAICVVLAGAAVLEIAVPGRAVYHTGWLNVGLLACAVVAVVLARPQFARAHTNLGRGAVVATALGAIIAALATATCGLFAPDDRTVVGAPGQRVRVDDLGGSLVFPQGASAAQSSPAGDVVFERVGRAAAAIGERGRYAGAFALRLKPRTVVFVEARDLRGAHLTVTQPSGAVFLSPVLLMQQHQTIAGFDVPFDSFAVPAAHRLVRAVLFTPQQAAIMRGLEGGSGAAVLFAVDDENDRPLPHGVDAARSGTTIGIDGLLLRALVFDFPAVVVASVPSPPAALAGVVLVLGGFIVRRTARD